MPEPFIVNFPCRDVLVADAPFSLDMIRAIEQRVLGGECSEGYLYVERAEGFDILLFYRKALHSAVRSKLDGLQVLPLEDFFGDLQRRPPRRMRLCRTDVGLILLMAVVLQNTPTLKVTGDVADLDRVLADLAERGKPSGILMSRGRDRTLVFCRNGEPAAIYFGNRADEPADSSPRDKILAYGYTAPEQTTIEIFHNLQSRKDEHAAHRFADLLSGQTGPPPFFLQVRHGSKTVLRRLMQGGQAEVGRDPANDIVLDHLSVSRRHCVIAWEKGQYVIRDTGSANKTLVDGIAADASRLQPGNVITVGDFEITFSEQEEASAAGELQTLFMDSVPNTGQVAQVVHDGKPIALQSAVFTIGKGSDVSLRLKGLFMRPIQATIIRETDGRYRVFETSGGKPVSVNGSRVGDKGVTLDSGSQIAVGKHQITFLLTEAPPA